jgi:hypothetical protein
MRDGDGYTIDGSYLITLYHILNQLHVLFGDTSVIVSASGLECRYLMASGNFSHGTILISKSKNLMICVLSGFQLVHSMC